MLELTVAIVAHAGLGVAVAAAVWAVGLGCVRGLREGDGRAYAFGLLVLSVAALLVVASPWLGPVALVLVLAPLARLRRSGDVFRRAVSPFAWSLPAALGLGLALGLLNHGPTEEEDSTAYGDMLFYAAKTVAATESLFPFRDLTVEGENHVWVETGWTFLAAALSWLPGVDVVLLQAATAPAFLVAAVAIGVGLLPVPERRSASLPVAAVLAVSFIAYPTWLAESPPVALAVPLAFPVYALWRRRLPPAWFAVAVTAIGVDLFLTKGFGGIPFAVVATVVLLRDHARRPWAYVLFAAAAAAGAVVFVLTSAWLTDLLELKFLPADAIRGLRRQLDVRDTQAAAPAFQVVGQVLLAAALLRTRAFTFAAALGASLFMSWIVGGHGFDIAVGLSVLLAVLLFLEQPGLLERHRLLVAAAAVSLTLSAWFRDISGVHAGFLLVALLAAGLVAAMVRRPLPVAAAAAVVALGVLLGLGERQTTLTRADFALWRHVADAVANDALVFTSQTGPQVTGTQGWNYYPGVAGRQVYLAGWSNSRLVVDRTQRARRLHLNRAVLSGRLSPALLHLSRRYGDYYGVLLRGERAPPSFSPVYRNGRFVLYRIRS